MLHHDGFVQNPVSPDGPDCLVMTKAAEARF